MAHLITTSINLIRKPIILQQHGPITVLPVVKLHQPPIVEYPRTVGSQLIGDGVAAAVAESEFRGGEREEGVVGEAVGGECYCFFGC